MSSQSLTERFTTNIASRLLDVSIYKGEVDTYKQVVVIIGRKVDRRHVAKEYDVATEEHCCNLRPRVGFLRQMEAMFTMCQISRIKAFKPISYELKLNQVQQEISDAHSQTNWPIFNQIFATSLAKANH